MDDELRGEFRDLFRTLNNGLFEPRLPMPEFLESKKNCILGFKVNVDQNVICIGKLFKDTLASNASNDKRIIFDELLHQMCHIKNRQEKIKDQTKHDRHNKQFIKTALLVGLTIKKGSLVHIASISHCLGCREECKACVLIKPELEVAEKTEKLYDKMINYEILKNKKDDDAISSKRYLYKYECGCEPPHNFILSGCSPNGKYAIDDICCKCKQKRKCKKI